jgi:large subunit ribosomal protein L19
MRNEALDIVEQGSLREDALSFEIGDTVDVHCRIQEGTKERIQVFSGIVIAHRRGNGVTATFTVRRLVAGEGVERIFPVHSPKIAKLDVKRHGVVRRAKLFYLRDRVGKATRLAERREKKADE